MTASDIQAAEILDKALELAELTSWEKLNLHVIAADLGIGLDEIRQYFQQKDDLVEAWYDRADSAMLQFASSENLVSMNIPDRLSAIIMCWLNTLAAHRKISGDMLLYKLEPGHIHLQVQGLLRISRTVQWVREAAGLDTTHLFRIAEEIGLTSIFLSTFAYWLQDASPASAQTQLFLHKRLKQADFFAHKLSSMLPGANSKPEPSDINPEA